MAAWAERFTRRQEEMIREHLRERESEPHQMPEKEIVKEVLGAFQHKDGSLMSLAEVIEAIRQEEAAANQTEERNHDNKRKDGKSQRDC